MTFEQVLLLVALGGTVGGLIDLFFQMELNGGRYRFEREGLTWRSFFLLVLKFCLVGIGGAMAILLVLIVVGKFEPRAEIDNTLLLLSLSIVAGFAGRRLLPIVARKLEEEVAKTRKEAEEATERAEHSRKKAEEAAERAELGQVLTMGLVILEAGTLPTVRNRVIRELRELRRKRPTDRRLTFRLGRLLKKTEDYDGAIEVMNNFLSDKATRGEEMDIDSADAIYNRACYYALKFRDNQDEDAKEQAYRNLTQSIEISPENKLDARVDPDFEHLRDEHRFRELTGDE